MCSKIINMITPDRRDMSKKIKYCNSYLASITEVGRNFDAIAEVKTKSILNDFETVDVPNSTFLVIGPNIIPWGLYKLGGDVTVINGITDYGDVKCDCKHYDGELADFVAQGIKFDYVIGPDECLTYANDETEQRQMLSIISKITNTFITTLKDYKNMYANQRYFEEPFVLRTDKGDAIVIRKREWDQVDRQAWIQENYVIHNEELYICPEFKRRTMYFKQLAKFSSDIGSKSFTVDKKIMYKPAFSKTFEYIVNIKF